MTRRWMVFGGEAWTFCSSVLMIGSNGDELGDDEIGT